ncbi:MAG TPA: DnaJ domain-containing protein, partial [Burkholderiaceae bacterium]|nr:DnaJ domain-containing protein [Burkholderiaceae bacterium]
ELLERVAALGALSFEEPPRQERRVSPAPSARPSGAFRLGPIVETSASADVKHPAAALYDPTELEEDVDIDLSRRRTILDLFYRLDQLDHYQLFNVPPSADKKAIKAAYFDVVNVFHPDRYFGKKVGSFKPKLEKVFSRLTESYNVLSRNQSRQEYDAYLRAQSKTRAFDAGQIDSAAHQAALQEVMRRIAAEASAESRGQSVPPPSPSLAPAPIPSATPQSAGSTGPRPSSNPALRPSHSMRPSDPEVRRRALARKLGRPLPGAEKAPSEAELQQRREQQAQESQARHDWAAEELKRRYQERVQVARNRQIEVYTRAAKQALDKGDHVGASNALRIAASLAPEDQALAERLSEVSGRARSELATSYLEQAEYEERDEKWLAAAKSYTKALTGRPEARIHERIAHCLLSGDGDLREAGERAKQAVMLEPDTARFRVTLARFYVKAGMKQSAEGELSRAATLAPSDDKVADWIRRLKRELG